MKTKQILLAFVCLGCAFCLLNSCSKNLELIPSPVDDNSIEIQLKNGMLVFPSRMVLSKVLSGKGRCADESVCRNLYLSKRFDG